MRGDLDWDAVIAGILNLVIRIETDRQETLQKLCEIILNLCTIVYSV